MDKDHVRTRCELFARLSELPTVTEVQTELDRLMHEGHDLRELYADVSILALLDINTLGNVASKSKQEKIVMTPLTGIVFVSCLLVAIFSV